MVEGEPRLKSDDNLIWRWYQFTAEKQLAEFTTSIHLLLNCHDHLRSIFFRRFSLYISSSARVTSSFSVSVEWYSAVT